MLPASAYPVQIVQAQRWLDKNKALVAKNDYSGIDNQNWDPAVKALARFPDVIKMMSADLDWTTDLGDAEVNQPQDVAEVIQDLRAKAEAAGTLKTTDQQTVERVEASAPPVAGAPQGSAAPQATASYISIQPTDPSTVYVPTYDPSAVYQSYSGIAPLLGFGAGIAVGALWNNGTKILRVGKNGWTLPLPLGKTDAGWRFDVAKGKEEMANRRVGYNELSAIEACKAYVAAQDEYFRLDRDGNGLREYARRFISTPGTHDGLYWPPEDQADISPLDGFAEDANLAERSGEKPEPYMGYYFRILTAQGPAAPGGAFSYLINGHMIAGHAMVAWPAAYGDSGVETFVCDENGVVYQKDLGPNTAALGASMAQYNPDASWKVVE